MSVYIHKKTSDGVYSYDFQINGRRFHGSTGKTTRRDAEAEEKRIKEAARLEIAEEKKRLIPTGTSRTVEHACQQFWEEKRLDYSEENRKHILFELDWIAAFFPEVMVHEIGDAEVARMVAARRGEQNRTCKQEARMLANGTVNRMTKMLRRVLSHARKVWKCQVQEIDWTERILKEPQERVREASVEEENALLDHLARGYEDLTRFTLIMGIRKAEGIKLEWTAVDFFNDQVSIQGKGDKRRILPLPPEMRDLLWSLKDNHPTFVFTYVAKQTRKLNNGKGIIRGERYPLTNASLRHAFGKARADGGVVNFRYHDTRHTAATRLLREEKNLRIVQTLLGHSRPETTAKYAHVTQDDLAQALANVSRKRREHAKSPGKIPGNTRDKSARN